MSDENKPASTEKPKRNRPSRAAVPTGPIHPREMTKIRDRVGKARDQLRAGAEPNAIARDLDELWTDLDRLDLRFKVHHDPSSKKEG